ncbi:hypothetical protein BH23BAC4_BH23BAC4_05640 [soil metagenome]
MDILKVFFEEPFSLEAAAPAEGRATADAHRLYLAGTRLTRSDRPLVGLSALTRPEIYVNPLLSVFGDAEWTGYLDGGAVEILAGPRLWEALAHPATVMACGHAPTDLLTTLSTHSVREALPELAAALTTARAILIPEPAHDGADWSVFASEPIRARFSEALRLKQFDGARRFMLPFQRARSEERFYFEQWQLEALPEYIEEL